MLISRKLYLEIGGFDENYFFYNEDLDLCRRVIQKKLAVIYYPKTWLIHIGGGSSNKQSQEIITQTWLGSLYFCKKFYPQRLNPIKTKNLSPNQR
jgi:GT2 family glycosyltransferase